MNTSFDSSVKRKLRSFVTCLIGYKEMRVNQFLISLGLVLFVFVLVPMLQSDWFRERSEFSDLAHDQRHSGVTMRFLVNCLKF